MVLYTWDRTIAADAMAPGEGMWINGSKVIGKSRSVEDLSKVMPPSPTPLE
jgi:hypothetical protein